MELKRKGHTGLETQIVGLVRFLLQTNFRYCGLYVRPDPEGPGNLFGMEPDDLVILSKVVRAVAHVYHSSFDSPEQQTRFQNLVEDILRTHSKFKVITMVRSLGLGDFSTWPTPNNLISLFPSENWIGPHEYTDQYFSEEVKAGDSWGQAGFTETSFQGIDPFFQLKIEILQLRPRQMEGEEEADA